MTAVEREKLAKKIWNNNWYHNDNESFELFYKWFEHRKIVKSMNMSCWRQVTKKGIRGLRDPKQYADWDWILKDHTTEWKDENGKKYIICQPYWWYPEHWEQFEEHFNGISKNGDFEPKLQELINWGNERNLNIVFYKASDSWYYPNHTIMYEISEKDI